MAVSPAGSRIADVKPFTSKAGGLRAKFRHHPNNGWSYTAGEIRSNLANCPSTNPIAQDERQRIALGQACAELLNDGRLSRAELPRFHAALIMSTKCPYRSPHPTSNLATQLLAFARSGCAAQIAATLPQAEWRNYNLLPLSDSWQRFVARNCTLAEAAETAPRTSTPADGTLLGTAHANPADPLSDMIGAWSAEANQAQRQLFTYGLGTRRNDYFPDKCKPLLAHTNLYTISRSHESVRVKDNSPFRNPSTPFKSLPAYTPVGVVEALLYARSVEGCEHPSYAPVQTAAARRSELAAHLTLGALAPVHDSALDALLDDPRNDWCETESEFRRKIVTAALSQTTGDDPFNTRADRLIAEHVIGGPSDDVTETEMRCLRTLLIHHYQFSIPNNAEEPTTNDYRKDRKDTAGTSGISGMALTKRRGQLPETTARLTARLRRYAVAANRLRRLSPEAASGVRQFLQTLLTVSDIPPRQRAELYVLERVATAGQYTTAV